MPIAIRRPFLYAWLKARECHEVKPSEVAIKSEQFKSEVLTLEGDDLLDKWIEFDGSAASKESDLGILKSLILESAMQQKIGMDWKQQVGIRKKVKPNA